MPFPNFFGNGQYNMQAPQMNPAFSTGGDFSGTLNDILAPYQRMASQFTSPYATMSPNSWLVRNHPQLAQGMDNAFLTMGMTPQAQGPEGAGGGISRMMQGLMGGQQYRREQMIRGAMLPYQMGMQQVQMQDTLSQIKEREAMAPYYRARSDWYEGRLEEANRPRYVPGSLKTDDKGNQWQERFDPTTGDLQYIDPNTGKSSRELGVAPSFQNLEKSTRRSAPGGLMGEIMDMQSSPDPAIRAEGDRRAHEYEHMQGVIAGGRAGAAQDATQPAKDLNTFVQDERREAFASLPRIMNQNELEQANLTNPEYMAQKYGPKGDPNKPYSDYLKQQQSIRQQLDVNLSKYGRSSAPRKGISFSEYMQNTSQYDNEPAALPPATPARNSGSNWTPSK